MAAAQRANAAYSAVVRVDVADVVDADPELGGALGNQPAPRAVARASQPPGLLNARTHSKPLKIMLLCE